MPARERLRASYTLERGRCRALPTNHKMRRLGSRRTGTDIWLIQKWSLRCCPDGTRYTSLIMRLGKAIWVDNCVGP